MNRKQRKLLLVCGLIVLASQLGLTPSSTAFGEIISVITDTTWRGIGPEGNQEETPITSVGLDWEVDNPGWNTSLTYDDTDAAGWKSCVDPWGPSYIWVDGDTENGSTPAYYRKVFELTGTPTSGLLSFEVDDDAFFYINGQLAFSDTDGVYTDEIGIDVTSLLVQGTNLIAVKAHDSFGYNEYLKINLDIEIEVEPLTPTVEIIKAKMVKIPPAFTECGLGVDLHVEFPASNNPYQSRYVFLQAVVNGQYISKEFDISGLIAAGEAKDIMWNAGQFIGEPLIVLDFKAADVPRFEANQKFDLMAEAWTSDGIVDFIVSDPSIKSVEIYLPVVIVHGYVFPETGSRLFGKILAPAIYESLENYLHKQDLNMKDPTREPFITGYTTDESPYQTIWQRNWQESWTPRQVGDWLHHLINDVRNATYAARVNIVGHSMGGLIGRYYASDADGWHPDASTRVHKLIMIGTPNRGVTEFYIFTGRSGWSAAKVESVGDDEPLGLWGVPTYCTDSGDALACCIYDSDDKPISPNRAIVRPTSDPHGKYTEEFPDQTSPPNGITYYSVFSGNTSTPYLGYVKPTAKHGETWYRWVSIKESMPGDGLVIESSAELPGVAISVPVPGATKLHAWLPADVEVQKLVIDKLRD